MFLWSVDKKIYRKLEHPALVVIYVCFHGHLHYNHILLPHWKGLLTSPAKHKPTKTFMVLCRWHFKNCRTGVSLWISVIGCLMPRLSLNLDCKQRKGVNLQINIGKTVIWWLHTPVIGEIGLKILDPWQLLYWTSVAVLLEEITDSSV